MRKICSLGMFTALAFALALTGAEAQKGPAGVDVQHYKIDAELDPASQSLKARAEVLFVPQVETRTVVFEMNGSLKISRITRVDSSATTTAKPVAPGGRAQNLKTTPPKGKETQPASDGLQFIQDNLEKLNVRIDLGDVVP